MCTDKKILPDKSIFILSNGLKLIVVEWHSLPMIHIDLMIHAGTFSEPAKMAGLAQATSYLPSQGTSTRHATRIAEEIDFIGAKLRNDSQEDASYLSLTILKKHLAEGLEIFNDLLLNPSFPKEELERWQKRTIASIAQEKADPSIVASRKFKNFAFGDYPYGNIITENTINTITQDEVKNYFYELYRPNNSVLVIVGDVDATIIADDMEKLLAQWENKSVPSSPASVPSSTPGYAIQFINKADSNQAQIRFGYISISRNSPDYYPVVLINYVLGGGGFSSRLMKEIRSVKGYTYGINSNFNLYKHSGLFAISTFTKNENVPDMIKEIINQLKLLKEKGITDEELKNAKSYYKGSFVRRFERPERIADQILDTELYGLGDEYLDTYRSKIDEVTPQQIEKVIEKLILTDRANIVIVGKAKDYAETLKKLGKTELKDYSE